MFELEKVAYKGIIKIDSLHIKKGVVTCIVGESGSGKTSLLKLLNWMAEPDAGDIRYNNESIFNMNPIEYRRKVSMLSQTPFIHPGTVKDNLLLGLKLTGRKKISEPGLEKLLQIVFLEKSLSEDADNLSGGERQRLALARILCLNPEVYLLDEPTAALDEETEMKVMSRFFHKIKGEGRSAVMITHSKRLAESLGDEIIMLNKNREGEKSAE
ncbi:ABC transporter ATP-binding protein [Bacillus massiliglaciei]|uniref:ABC transporter ATP-binding protein n=1 Tax=Bacillus massiliglaciei TaxID=1816693 RepID=UPI000DA60FE4|nr:ABC transporter ATP-binding protein [Bacillus massiliglaciei]